MNSTNSADDSSVCVPLVCPDAPGRGKKVSRTTACQLMPRRLNFDPICPPAPRKRQQTVSRIPIVISGEVIRQLDFEFAQVNDDPEFSQVNKLTKKVQRGLNKSQELLGGLKVLIELTDL